MASFSLRSQRTGQYKEFTLLEVLYLLGDRVNDEIWLQDGEDVFNLSSFRELGVTGEGNSSGSKRESWSVETPTRIAGQNSFLLQYLPSTDMLLVILNGMVQAQGSDFNLEGRMVRFSFPLNAQDSLKFIYQY